MRQIGMIALAFILFAGLARSQDRIAELRVRFARESNPVNKAKIMPELGDAEFAVMDKDLMAERVPEALAILRQYRAEAQTCEKGLDAARIDAGKHSAGFKHLQISLQESLRRLGVFVARLTSDEQVPFLEVRKDLNEMDQHLIHQLFPRDPAAHDAPPKSDE
jgi:hypothetical protein